jgi:Ca-activated chloride channel family protein
MKKWGWVLLGLMIFIAGCSFSGSSGDNNAPDSGQNTATTAKSDERRSREPLPLPKPAKEEYNHMIFDEKNTNPFIATEDDALSTFAVDVDTGSYSIVRSYIKDGVLPPKEAFRVEEFVNYFKSTIEPPAEDTFAVRVDGGPSPFGENYELMRVSLRGKEIVEEERKPAHLTFVIDVSGSMDKDNRLGLVQQSLRLLVNELSEDDQISIVTYGTKAKVVLRPTSLEDKEAVLDAIDRFQPGGTTNAEGGLELGYEMASRQYKEDAINRVILCSDGVANVGKTSAEEILKDVEDYTAQGITLTTVGFGMGNYNDILMEQLADKGNGIYAYVDGFSEARKLFMEKLSGTLQLIARDVKIQVAFDPEKVDRYRLLGYENRDIADEAFEQEDTDAGEVGVGHTVTALYEVRRKDEAIDSLGEVRVRYMDEDSQERQERVIPLEFGGELDRELGFLSAVAEYAEIMRGSFWAQDSSLDEVLKLAEASAQGEEQQEFVGIVKDTIALQRSEK